MSSLVLLVLFGGLAKLLKCLGENCIEGSSSNSVSLQISVVFSSALVSLSALMVLSALVFLRFVFCPLFTHMLCFCEIPIKIVKEITASHQRIYAKHSGFHFTIIFLWEFVDNFFFTKTLINFTNLFLAQASYFSIASLLMLLTRTLSSGCKLLAHLAI